ncbi:MULTISPECIES: cation diffusion facilitator family transporter [Halorussus]|uniref:cation diffusion facilitator family transporter n=1 Tax=Halorussus TaxID=1070314 RepID=UPI0020A09333|nr:cation diffusion facilitator family transporter [Halorussus vallis]USZ74556.1 cation diffusion facilitator family transporter [Halorussus vallis]
MAHDHDDRSRHPGHDHTGDAPLRALAVALAINTGFLVVEFVGALYADSLTLLADAIHMLADSASLGLALLAAWVSARPADPKRTYGYQRAEVLGAFLNGVFLLVTVGYILYDAFRRFQDPRQVRPLVVVGVGVAGLGANLAAAWVLRGRRELLNVEGAFLHLLADALGSVAAVVVGVALVYTDLLVLDPLFALLVAALVLYSAKDLLADSLNILLQGTPRDVDVEEVARYLERLDGVVDAHDVHVWALDSTHTALSAHVVVADGTSPDAVVSRCQSELGRKFDIDHATVQVESESYSHVAEFDCYESDGKP